MFRFSANYQFGEEPPKKPEPVRIHKGFASNWNSCAGVESPPDTSEGMSRYAAARYSTAPRWGRNI